MSSAKDTLVDMGFSKEQAEKALEVTGNQGVEPAMEWLLAHGDELSSEQTTPPGGSTVGGTAAGGGSTATTDPTVATELQQQDETSGDQVPEAKSLQCADCNKLFRTQAEVEFHAAKTGHANFSESTEEKKPLTEEEKRAQLKLVEEKLALKKKEREEREKAEALEREKKRIQAGKEMVNIRKKMEDEELRKAIEERKREKEEDRMARQKIKDQIEADRVARRIKQQGLEAATASGVATQQPTVATSASNLSTSTVATNSQAAKSSPATKKDYSETRIQIRLLNGQSLTQTFGAKEQLSAVRLYIEMNRTDDPTGVQPFSLMTNFPKRIFTGEDFDKPLDLLGLVPSAVLILTKSQPQ